MIQSREEALSKRLFISVHFLSLYHVDIFLGVSSSIALDHTERCIDFTTVN